MKEDTRTIMTRKEAFDAGKSNYFTGKICKNGHRSERKIATGACISCTRMYNKQYQKNIRKQYVKGLVELRLLCPREDVSEIRMIVRSFLNKRNPEDNIPSHMPRVVDEDEKLTSNIVRAEIPDTLTTDEDGYSLDQCPYNMRLTAKAGETLYKDFIAKNWTIETMIAHGYLEEVEI